MTKYLYIKAASGGYLGRMVNLGDGVAQPQKQARNIWTNTEQIPVVLNDAMIARWLENGTDEEL
jgi:hypothetical protein